MEVPKCFFTLYPVSDQPFIQTIKSKSMKQFLVTVVAVVIGVVIAGYVQKALNKTTA